jgi:hypothetical protein
MARTIIVGDVHGCSYELDQLLCRIDWTRHDRLFFVGDLFSRGPDPKGVLELFLATGARAVRGNHENSLLVWHVGNKKQRVPVSPSHRETVAVLRDKDWKLLRSLPLFIDLPDHALRIVHAGVVPGVPIEKQQLRALVKMRYLGETGEPIEMDGTTLWAVKYVGPPHVVFGHNARFAPQIHPWATGIDTGAVYGGRLTAMVLDKGQAVPPAPSRRDVLFSVPALRRYYDPTGGDR